MKRIYALILSILIIILPNNVFAEGEEVNLNWVPGPTSVDLGEKLAKLKVTDEFVYLDKSDTIAYNEAIGNPIIGTEIGSVFPKNEEEYWFIVFEYNEVGHIKDAKSEDINADDILDSYKQGNEEFNKELEADGYPTMEVLGWDEEPFFDEETNNLTWSMAIASSDGTKSVNYNTRILTRKGYLSAVLVADPTELEKLKPKFKEMLKGLEIKEGEKYSDFDPSVDKVSEIGLTALIAGGVGAAAAKKGIFAGLLIFFKKFAVIIIGALAATGTWLKKKFSKPKDKNNKNQEIA